MKKPEKLILEGENYTLDNYNKVRYKEDHILKYEDFLEIFNFAYEMTYGDGHHRNNRSGGSQNRNKLFIFNDILRGKIGEFSFYNFIQENSPNTSITQPDLSIHPKGIWDSGDFVINGKYHISVKTSKHFSNLLLLESKDYEIQNDRAIYNPSNSFDNFIFMVRAKTNPIQPSILEKHIKEKNTQELYEQLKISTQISGYISNNDLKNIISNDYTIKKGHTLNQKTKIDADNYYIMVKFMKEKEKILTFLNKKKPRNRPKF